MYSRILIHRIILLSGCLLAGLSFGCGQQGNPKDVAEIKTNYVAFRSAVIAKDFDRARQFVGLPFALIYSPERVQRTFRRVLEPNGNLTPRAYIRFSQETNAYLWPHDRPVVGSTGIGFTKETNGWKLNGSLQQVQD